MVEGLRKDWEARGTGSEMGGCLGLGVVSQPIVVIGVAVVVSVVVWNVGSGLCVCFGLF